MTALASLPARSSTRGRLTLGTIGVWAAALSYVAFFISDTMLALNDDRSQMVKIFAFVVLLIAIVLRPQFHRWILLLGPVLFVLLLGLLRSFNGDAGLEEFLRFFFPIVITIALYAYRDRLQTLVSVLLIVVISNDLFQCYFYIAYLTGMPLLIPVRIDSGLFLRAQGWMGFFSEFSFINLCAFMLCRWQSPTETSKARSWVFLLFGLLGFSFKLFAPLLLYPLIVRKGTPRTWLAIAAMVGAGIFLVGNGYLDGLIDVAASKISFYVTAGNSARAESYRVMFESLSKGNLIGEGLGSFGGPASVKYGSPLYSEYHFNWFKLGDILKTTDTFYPHLFVEIGFLGAAAWLLFVLLYGQGAKRDAPWIFMVVTFCFDNLFSMSFLSPSYVFSALLVLYVLSRRGSPFDNGTSPRLTRLLRTRLRFRNA
ncbi:hypothetical protein [Caballeronia sp. M23-90]